MAERRLLLMACCVSTGGALLPSVGHTADDAARLAADPDQLRRIEKQCQNDWTATGDALCAAASKARRERFLGRRGGNDPLSTTEVGKPRSAETADPKPGAAARSED